MSPKTQVIKSALPFHTNLFTSLSPKVAAFWRLTISLSWGWRHFPGVPEPSEGVVATGAALGVEGADCVAIYRVSSNVIECKESKGPREEGEREWRTKRCHLGSVKAHRFEDHQE